MIYRGPPQTELNSTTKAKRQAFANSNMRTNWKLLLFTERNEFSFKYPAVMVDNVKWLKRSEGQSFLWHHACAGILVLAVPVR